MYPRDYPAQAGILKGTLSSILISLEVNNPDLFQEIMEFEMKVTKKMKADNEKKVIDTAVKI